MLFRISFRFSVTTLEETCKAQRLNNNGRSTSRFISSFPTVPETTPSNNSLAFGPLRNRPKSSQKPALPCFIAGIHWWCSDMQFFWQGPTGSPCAAADCDLLVVLCGTVSLRTPSPFETFNEWVIHMPTTSCLWTTQFASHPSTVH